MFKQVSVVPAVKVTAYCKQIMEQKLRKEILKRLANNYKCDSACSKIKSEGNGL